MRSRDQSGPIRGQYYLFAPGLRSLLLLLLTSVLLNILGVHLLILPPPGSQSEVSMTHVLTNQRPVLPVLVPSPVLAVPHHPVLLLLLLLGPELSLGVESPTLTNEKQVILTNERLVLTSLGSSVAHSGRWSLFSCL